MKLLIWIKLVGGAERTYYTTSIHIKSGNLEFQDFDTEAESSIKITTILFADIYSLESTDDE